MRRIPKQFALAVLSLACIVWLAACSTWTPVLQFVTITPSTATISVGGTQQFTAQAYYSNGGVQDGAGLVAWASSNSSVATIDQHRGTVAASAMTGVASIPNVAIHPSVPTHTCSITEGPTARFSAYRSDRAA